MSSPVLVSWIARNNDPYSRKFGSEEYRLDKSGNRITGPTLNVLFDKDSPFRGAIKDAVLLYRRAPTDPESPEERIFRETRSEILKRERGLKVSGEVWKGEDPTDHKGIYQFLSTLMPELRQRYSGRELIVHISPGTPSMHTIWVLMAETGLIEKPFRIVKSYRPEERKGRLSVTEVDVGIETFYKAYRLSRPREVPDEENVWWDPAKFQSKQLQNLFMEARRFAKVKVPVMILGERGTGKTTFAGWIRSQSPFKVKKNDKAWPVVACGQYTAETMRAELFGHVKGAFTGAVGDKPGLLKTAHNDTLFLDEVGDMSPDLQRLLIRALEEKTYQPLGSDENKKSDFRLVTATNRPWADLETRLDPDFLDRISIVTLELPALRDMREDIDWIWPEVLRQAAGRAAAPSVIDKLEASNHTAIVRALKKHQLPGNLRDLFRVAYVLVAALSDDDEVLTPKAAVAYALDKGLRQPAVSSGGDVSSRVAAAFARRAPLDDLLQSGTVLETGAIERELKAYMASELRRIAKERGVKTDSLCDVSERSLRTWVK